MAGEIGNPSGGRGLTGDFRTAAIAKASGAGRGGFGPEPGRQGGQKELQGKIEARNRAKAEREQDAREMRSGVYRGGAGKEPIPSNRPGGGVGLQGTPGRRPSQHNPYGSNRNFPTTV